MNGPATRRAYIRDLNRRTAGSPLKNDAPWRRVVLRFLPDGRTMTDFYERMGWTQSVAYGRRKRPALLTLIEAAQMAKAVRAPDMGEFLVELALAQGIPNLHELSARRNVEG